MNLAGVNRQRFSSRNDWAIAGVREWPNLRTYQANDQSFQVGGAAFTFHLVTVSYSGLLSIPAVAKLIAHRQSWINAEITNSRQDTRFSSRKAHDV